MKEFNTNYVMSDLLVEPDMEKMLSKLKIYNQMLKRMALANGDVVYEQVAVEGPILFVYEESIA